MKVIRLYSATRALSRGRNTSKSSATWTHGIWPVTRDRETGYWPNCSSNTTPGIWSARMTSKDLRIQAEVTASHLRQAASRIEYLEARNKELEAELKAAKEQSK